MNKNEILLGTLSPVGRLMGVGEQSNSLLSSGNSIFIGCIGYNINDIKVHFDGKLKLRFW